MPVVLVELPGERYWEAMDQFVRQQLLARDLICPEDLSFYKIVHSAEEAVNSITAYYTIYHSMRQVKDKLVIRLEKEITDTQVMELNEHFSDLIQSGNIFKTSSLPGEEEEPHLQAKPRIAFFYNHSSAGRLYQMIQTINKMGY